MQGDKTTCPFIIPDFESNAQQLKKSGMVGPGVCCADLKEELEIVKRRLDSLVAEVWEMKVKPVEQMPGKKPEVDKKNLQIVVDASVLFPLFVGLVGVLIGVLVACMWK